MTIKTAFLSFSLVVTVSAAIVSVAIAQDVGSGMMQGGMGPGMMGSQDTQSSARSNNTQGPMNPGMMCSGSCPCMQDSRSSSGMMDFDMMHRGMGVGMMGRSMHARGMGTGMVRSFAGSGMDALFGSRVVRTLNLSVDDVRNYLSLRLDRLNNKRLKLGDVKSEDETITADVVTVDNSLVQRLKVDRHTGDIEYEN